MSGPQKHIFFSPVLILVEKTDKPIIVSFLNVIYVKNKAFCISNLLPIFAKLKKKIQV